MKGIVADPLGHRRQRIWFATRRRHEPQAAPELSGRGPAATIMDFPSGVQVRSLRGYSVNGNFAHPSYTLRSTPPSAGFTYTPACSGPRMPTGPAAGANLTNAIHRPSGDQAGDMSRPGSIRKTERFARTGELYIYVVVVTGWAIPRKCHLTSVG